MQSLQPFIDPAWIAEQRFFRLVPVDRVTCRGHAVAKILGDLHQQQDDAADRVPPWGEDPAAGKHSVRDHETMKKPKHWSQSHERVHVPADDRARAWSGKTTDSKVRSEGRYLAAAQQDTETKRVYQATEAKTDRKVLAAAKPEPCKSRGD
jgi:hypothetical protein